MTSGKGACCDYWKNKRGALWKKNLGDTILIGRAGVYTAVTTIKRVKILKHLSNIHWKGALGVMVLIEEIQLKIWRLIGKVKKVGSWGSDH